MRWSEIEQSQPRLARLARERMIEPGVVLVATIRRDGTPRLSPVEPYVLDGDLWLSMMWQSTKARDLLRDPRILVHSVITNRDGTEGEFKIRGTVRADLDPVRQRRYADAVAADLGWKPQPGRFHLFAVDLSQVTFITYDPGGSGDQHVAQWPPGREFIRRGTSPTSVGDPEPASDYIDLPVGAGLVDLGHDAMRAGRLGDRGRLGQQRAGVVGAAVGGGDVRETDQVRGHARQQAELSAQPSGLLQPLAGGRQPAGPVLGDAQVPQRFRYRVLGPGLFRQRQRSLEDRDRGLVVAPDDLVEAADPEQRLGLAAYVGQTSVELGRALEQHELALVLGRLTGIGVELHEEPRVDDPSPGESETCFDPVELAIGGRQRILVAGKDSALVQQPGVLDPVAGAHRRLRSQPYSPRALTRPWIRP